MKLYCTRWRNKILESTRDELVKNSQLPAFLLYQHRCHRQSQSNVGNTTTPTRRSRQVGPCESFVYSTLHPQSRRVDCRLRLRAYVKSKREMTFTRKIWDVYSENNSQRILHEWGRGGSSKVEGKQLVPQTQLMHNSDSISKWETHVGLADPRNFHVNSRIFSLKFYTFRSSAVCRTDVSTEIWLAILGST